MKKKTKRICVIIKLLARDVKNEKPFVLCPMTADDRKIILILSTIAVIFFSFSPAFSAMIFLVYSWIFRNFVSLSYRAPQPVGSDTGPSSADYCWKAQRGSTVERMSGRAGLRQRSYTATTKDISSLPQDPLRFPRHRGTETSQGGETDQSEKYWPHLNLELEIRINNL